ncbi:MAG: hypothetical protein QOH62_24, partial [Solirubrobacteraceae bacterium]|nr:hypothetical protein [Solirubrobacteraceae bacterium]
DKAPEGSDPEVSLRVVQPKEAPKPVAVGAEGSGDEEHHEEEPVVPEAPPEAAE